MCRIHNIAHLEFTCSLCEEAINQVRCQLGLVVPLKECIADKNWSTYLAIEYKRRIEEHIVTSFSGRNELESDSMIEPNDQFVEMEVKKTIEDIQASETVASNDQCLEALEHEKLQVVIENHQRI